MAFLLACVEQTEGCLRWVPHLLLLIACLGLVLSHAHEHRALGFCLQHDHVALDCRRGLDGRREPLESVPLCGHVRAGSD